MFTMDDWEEGVHSQLDHHVLRLLVLIDPSPA
jgi:hypothetical protein